LVRAGREERSARGRASRERKEKSQMMIVTCEILYFAPRLLIHRTHTSEAEKSFFFIFFVDFFLLLLLSLVEEIKKKICIFSRFYAYKDVTRNKI
jgi:hypothetical protein